MESSHRRFLLVPYVLSTANSGISQGTPGSSPAVFTRYLQLVSHQDCANDMKLGKAASIAGARAFTSEGLHGLWG